MTESNRLPPTLRALKQHILRVHIQASIWGQASIAQQEFFDPLQNGFCKYANGDLVLHTTDDLPAPTTIIGMVNWLIATVRERARNKGVACRSHNLPCTELCLCSTECQNDDDYNCNPVSDESTNDMMTYGRYGLERSNKCLLYM